MNSSLLEAPKALWERVSQEFERAAVLCGEEVRFVRIAGLVVRLRFAGAAMIAPTLAALSHLRVEAPAHFDLSVCVWDGASTKVFLAPPSWTGADLGARCTVRGFDAPPLFAFYEQTNRLLHLLNIQTNEGFFYLPDAQALPPYQIGSPLLLLLHAWLEERDLSLVHGGAIGTSQGGVLLAGKGGTGKSTTALACLNSDLPLLYAGDDYALVSTKAQPFVHSLYCSGKVLQTDVPRFPRLAPARHLVLDSHKALYLFHPAFASRLSPGFSLRAIVVPRIGSARETRAFPASAAQTLLALAPSTLLQLPGAEREKLARLSRLVRELPCFFLQTGSDWNSIPRAVHELIEGLPPRL